MENELQIEIDVKNIQKMSRKGLINLLKSDFNYTDKELENYRTDQNLKELAISLVRIK